MPQGFISDASVERPAKRLKQGSLSSFFVPRPQSVANQAEEQPQAPDPDEANAVSEAEGSDQDSEPELWARGPPLRDARQPVSLSR
jgi:hypothetical protein